MTVSDSDARGAIFDMDGTLADTSGDIMAAVNETRAAFSLPPLDRVTILSYIGDGMMPLLERSLRGTGVAVESAASLMREAYFRHMDAPLYPGVAEGVRALVRAGWNLAIFSNKLEACCRRILHEKELDGYFPVVIGGDSGFPVKPNPDAIFSLMTHFRIGDPARIWMVGDNHTDLLAGARAGVPTAFAAYGFGSQGDVPYTFRADSFSGLVRHLL